MATSSSSTLAIVYVFLSLGIACVFGLVALIVYGFQLMHLSQNVEPSAVDSMILDIDQRLSEDSAEARRPTDFAEVGTLRFPTLPNPTIREAVLEYAGPDNTTTSVPIVFDGSGLMTICVRDNWGLPCAAMSMTYDAAFGGKRAVVEGVVEDGKVLMHKLRVYGPDEQVVKPAIGTTYVEWEDVVSALNTCRKVKTVFDNQSEKTVRLTFWNDSATWEALQPLRESLLTALDDAKKTNCSVFPQVSS